MFKQGIAKSFSIGLLSCALTSSWASAKPADLPSNNQYECDEAQDGDAPTRRFSFKVEITPKGVTFGLEGSTLPGAPASAPTIDAVLPPFVEQWLEHASDAVMRPDRAQNLHYLVNRLPFVGAVNGFAVAASDPAVPMPQTAEPEKKVDFEAQVRQLFESADRYRRKGLLEGARFFYQRVHLLAPTSRLGQLAIDRLQELESRERDDAEEQSNPARPDEPEARNRDLRNGTIPLGLVEIRY